MTKPQIALLLKSPKRKALNGPERVKTLSYLVCLSQCSWAWRFPEHLPRSAPVTRESVYEALWRSCSSQSRGFYAAIAFNKPSVPMIFITRFRL